MSFGAMGYSASPPSPGCLLWWRLVSAGYCTHFQPRCVVLPQSTLRPPCRKRNPTSERVSACHQAIGNSLWGYAAMGAFPSEEVLVKSCNRMLALLAGEAGENVGGMTRRQTDQFCLAFELEGQCERL